jgi:hypothetical protein
MKFLTILFAGLAVVFVSSCCSTESRARFISAMNDLKEAHFELQKYGAFTNQFRDARVYTFTNRLTIDGTNYQFEFALFSDEFRERGLLTITTNGILVWIDNKQGFMQLGRQRFFPPGF